MDSSTLYFAIDPLSSSMSLKTFPSIPQLDVEFGMSKKVFLVSEREAEVTRSQDTSQLSLLAQLKPAWLAMKAFGLLPIFSAQPAAATEGKRIAIISVQAAYAAGIYLAFAAIVGKIVVGIKDTFHLLSSVSTLWITFKLLAVTFMTPHVLITPLHWARMHRILRYIKDWDAFQTLFMEVTRQPLLLNMRRRATVGIVLVLVGSPLVSYTLSLFLLEAYDYWGTLYLMYATTQIKLFLAVWVLLCQSCANAADQLFMKLKEEFLEVGVVGEHVVPGYHRVWLRLRQLTCDIGTIFSSVFHVIVSFWLALMLLSAFQSAKLVANGCSARTQTGLLLFGMLGLGSVQIFCHAASLATDAVGERFISSLSEIKVFKIDIQKQIQEFELAVGVHEAVINLGGYYNVNRSLVVSMLSAFSTYLIVLFQSTSASESTDCGNIK